MSEGTLRVLATGEHRVQLSDRQANLIRHKRITAQGLYDEISRQTKPGPVEVPDCRHYRRLVAKGVLLEAKDIPAAAAAMAEPAPEPPTDPSAEPPTVPAEPESAPVEPEAEPTRNGKTARKAPRKE